MKDESGQLPVFDVLDDRHEDGKKFIGFQDERLQAALGENFCIGEKFELILRLFQFLQSAFQLAD